jgi:hypothetical protein
MFGCVYRSLNCGRLEGIPETRSSGCGDVGMDAMSNKEKPQSVNDINVEVEDEAWF